MGTVNVQQTIPQEIVNFAVEALSVPSDYRTYICLNKVRDDIVRCWKPLPQILDSDGVPQPPPSSPSEDRTFEVVLIRLQGFGHCESYADVAYCKNTNTLVFGKFRYLVDDASKFYFELL